MKRLSKNVYCAFCRLERVIYGKKSISWTNVALAASAALLISVIVWSKLDPRAILFFCIFIFIAEVFVRIRWRLSLRCPHCGFDPVLYKTDMEQAVRQVQTRLAEVKSSGDYLLKRNNPLRNLPTRKIDDSVTESGRIISKQI